MKKLISYTLVFVLGFAACAYVLNRMGYTLSPGSSKQSMLQALSNRPAKSVVTKGMNPIAEAAALVGPAVVNIDTVQQVESPFAPFFGPSTQHVTGKASGVIISKDGYIITNNHVVAGAQSIRVRMADGGSFKARLIGRDDRSDLAVLKVDARNLPYAQLGNSDDVNVGDWAIAIGNPLGLENTVTVGVISATKRRDLPVEGGRKLEEAIQTDAAINHGNSGGALVNISGQLIGINTMIASTGPGGGNIGIGFAIPINSAKGIVKQLIENGKIIRPFLGVRVVDVSGDVATWYKQQGLSVPTGAAVAQVVPGSPAEKAGLTQFDVITQIDRKKISGAEDVTKAIQKLKVGRVVMVTIWRMGKTDVISARLAETPQ